MLPQVEPSLKAHVKPILVIACGALTREIHQLKKLNGWSHLDMQAIDASLHFTPQLIPEAVTNKIRQAKKSYEHIYLAYADCGTYGALDEIVKQEGVERLPGLHCYATFAGQEQFDDYHEEEPGTFYLTDFLVRHFERFVVKALKFDRHPELKQMFFGNYSRVIYLAQTRDDKLEKRARKISEYLDLDYQYVYSGYRELHSNLQQFVSSTANQL